MKPPCSHHKPMRMDYLDDNPKAETGAEQRQCPVCLRWFFHSEFGKGWGKAKIFKVENVLKIQK